MDPMHQQELIMKMQREARRPSFRDPDMVLHGPDSLPPDPVGVWAVEFCRNIGNRLSDRWSILRQRLAGPEYTLHPDAAPVPPGEQGDQR